MVIDDWRGNIMKRFCVIVSLYIIFCMLSGCRMFALGNTQKAETEPAENIAKSSLSVDEKVDRILNSMSTTEKIGQLMMIGIGKKTADEDSLYQLHRFHFGGIVLFDRNMESLEQVRLLTADLQKKCDEKLPLFIAIDEEGGEVVRMEEELTPPPSQMEIGDSGDVSLAKKWAAQTAKNLKDIGVNVNFAPVADLGSIGTRHYSTDADTTFEFVSAAATGYESEKMYYALKHFPGIGKGTTDSHDDSVVVDVPKSELVNDDLIPFRKIIEERAADAFFVMVSHVSYPELAGNTPASLSSEIMIDLLRKEMKFDGVIITDDMEMGAVSKYYGFRDLGVKAINAGADIVLVCHDYEHQQEVYLGILDAVKNGVISEERVNDSVRRIVKMKLKYLQ